MSKALVLQMSPLEDDTASKGENEEDCKEANGRDKPCFLDQAGHTGWWSLRRKGMGGVWWKLGLEE